MPTVTKKHLIDTIAERTDQKRVVVKQTVQEFLDLIIEELEKGNRLEFRDFGVFETKARAARTAQNPKTLQPVQVPEKTTVKFKVGRLMRERVEEAEKKPIAPSSHQSNAPEPRTHAAHEANEAANPTALQTADPTPARSPEIRIVTDAMGSPDRGGASISH
ncbi:MAG: HU family DNA-binding protein [Planctomycetota bacterium]